MCYNKTPFTPGRFLEEGLAQAGAAVDRLSGVVDFARLERGRYQAVIFVESPSRPPVRVRNIDLAPRPVFFWVHHGANRFTENLELCRQYQPDRVLLAHSLHLASRFPAPVSFFPFGAASHIFRCSRPLRERPIDIAFAGSLSEGVYSRRRALLEAIRKAFRGRFRLALNGNLYLNDLAALYGRSKIVVNCTADRLRTINMRLFEGIGCGALVVTDSAPGQERLLTAGKHCVVYSSIEQAVRKIAYHLSRLDGAQQIASAGFRHVHAHHTYKRRAGQLLAWIRQEAKKRAGR